jgi:hypothetical protein
MIMNRSYVLVCILYIIVMSVDLYLFFTPVATHGHVTSESWRGQRGRPAVAVCWGRTAASVRQCGMSRLNESNAKR